MTTTEKAIVLLIILLTSCNSIDKKVRQSYQYEMYIDFKIASYQGQNKTQRLYFEIDSVNGIWYDGKLIVNDRDTFPVHGFAKGSHYVTTYKMQGTDERGQLEIGCQGEVGQIRDSLTIQDRNLTSGIVSEKTTLYRKPRTICR